MIDDTGSDAPVHLFGDPQSRFIERGPDRRDWEPITVDPGLLPVLAREADPGQGFRSGRGDGFATALMILGVLVFGATVIAGTLILYNAKNIGAFSNPWDSTRVAIGLAVLAIGLVQSIVLVALSRLTSYVLTLLRMRAREGER